MARASRRVRVSFLFPLVVAIAIACTPSAPTGVQALGKEGKIDVTWDAVGGSTYEVFRSISPAGPFLLIGRTAEAVFIDSPVVNDVTFYYAVKAVDAKGQRSAISEVVEARAPSRDSRRGPVEECNGLDDDGDGQLDEGLADIATGLSVGACRPEIRSCVDGAYQLVEEGQGPAATETCGDGVDDDCNGVADEPEVCGATCEIDAPCSTGLSGVCAAGTTICPTGPFGAPQCQPTTEPSPEICGNDADEDCDGEQDDPDVCVACVPAQSCATGELGACAAGQTACPDGTFGAPVCERVAGPSPEICGNAVDEDCDGAIDDLDACTTCAAGVSCATGLAGVCGTGTVSCPGGPTGAPLCDPDVAPGGAEICGNGLDDDCDGAVDDPDVCGVVSCSAGETCQTGESGVCAAGTVVCPDGPEGAPVCQSTTGPSAELCDGLDNDCDGANDEDFDLGQVCDTGQLGLCATGILICSGGGAVCSPDERPQAEICNDGIDQDCDGSDCIILSIDVQAPAQGLVTAAEEIEVSGVVAADVTSVSVNGIEASLTGGGFSATVPLDDGTNMLVAIARDAEGNTGTDSVNVTRDTARPNVKIDSPDDGFRAIVDRVTITGLVNDVITGGINPRVTVNGIEATVQQGTFMVTDVPLLRGPNTITATASDSVGNTDTDVISVLFDPPTGAVLEPLSGDGQFGPVETELEQPLVARVLDAARNPLAGRQVTFRVSRNSGTLRAPSGATGREVTVTSDGSGLASAFLQLGDRSGEGNNRVTATSIGTSGEAIFCASGLPALPDKILAVMGENQKGLVSSPLAEPFEVLVVDPDGNPVAGLPVTFSVTAGGGHFDGAPSKNVLTGADGIALAVLTLGPEAGVTKNAAIANFADNAGLPATFLATGLAGGPEAETAFAGVVLDNTNTPIPGATVSIQGTPLSTLTDEQGQFRIDGAPVGAIELLVDPSTSTRVELFPPLSFETVTVSGEVNRLPIGPIRIPPLVSDAQVVGGAENVTLTMPGVPGLTLTVFANSATFPDGSKTGVLSVNQVHLDKVPMPPPSGTIFMPPAWTIQPANVVFDPPARITIPNDGLPPGRVIDIFQFDHTLNRFINVGQGTVDEEGLVIVSDRGFGITKSGWGGCGMPQPPPTCASSCDDTNRCTTDRCVDGRCVRTALTINPTTATMCEGCSSGTPIPKQTDAQCCATVSFGGGFVVCCNATKLACAGSSFGGSDLGIQELRRCVLQHERQHFGDVDCPAGSQECNTSRPPFKPGRNPADGECDAYRVENSCLASANCGGVTSCQSRVNARRAQLKTIVNNLKPGCIP